MYAADYVVVAVSPNQLAQGVFNLTANSVIPCTHIYRPCKIYFLAGFLYVSHYTRCPWDIYAVGAKKEGGYPPPILVPIYQPR